MGALPVAVLATALLLTGTSNAAQADPVLGALQMSCPRDAEEGLSDVTRVACWTIAYGSVRPALERSAFGRRPVRVDLMREVSIDVVMTRRNESNDWVSVGQEPHLRIVLGVDEEIVGGTASVGGLSYEFHRMTDTTFLVARRYNPAVDGPPLSGVEREVPRVEPSIFASPPPEPTPTQVVPSPVAKTRDNTGWWSAGAGIALLASLAAGALVRARRSRGPRPQAPAPRR